MEEATVLRHQALPGEQHLLRLAAEETSHHARPGHFIHLRCCEELPMRRPMSIMRADANAGWIEILFKVHGAGTEKLAKSHINERLNLLGPIGVPFKQQHYLQKPLLIGGGVGIPPLIFLAERLRAQINEITPFVLMGSEAPFPFATRPSQIMVEGIGNDVIACMPLLDDWGVASRLTSRQAYSGCYDGYVTGLARQWLDNLDAAQRRQVEIFSCGPTPMLKAVARLAQEYGLPCQICLEEYMACAVGGCAGCAVPVYQNGARSMQRVCVDGPVFAADDIYPADH